MSKNCNIDWNSLKLIPQVGSVSGTKICPNRLYFSILPMNVDELGDTVFIVQHNCVIFKS